ncbi:RNA polymerase sigma factor [Micromonospora sp. NPDC050187]|uniref:RNA polymerase sigma factor n=1 Tax=Micromonospora sp. NPDC050187 TaxID=3364277 RepID=UPI003795502E
MRSTRFEREYAAHYKSIFAYTLRRTADVQDARDVVAEVFLTAWRRLDDMPEGPQGLLWLYGVARRTLANHDRARRRHERLAAKVQAHAASPVLDTAAAYDRADSVAAAFGRLRPDDQDILGLIAVEGLTPAEAAGVLGYTAVNVRVRLHRARIRFARELNAEGVIM